ncbi:hypothetical protein DLAC_09026 [Tieghemostelium lacteum]|uniref:Uncharacterized protein n=1 Tax=Tieghemostelium lacteum TaxID=361077 RepID=A0A151Z8X7_TIELA|nr:hypothetical protein DLAC_09026 [Tieghemostelium lacteum]|eukprot:KYQ90407.1 hypothetical protein DLAC_09026 [Tieghemostelium lacteum]
MYYKNIYFLVFLILIFQLIGYNSQIVHGPKLYLGDVNRGDQGKNITKLQRYDWSWCKLYIRDNYTHFEASVTFHPRVDEFTTLQIPNSNSSIMHNPNITIWLEFPGKRNITTYIDNSVYEVKTLNCTMENGTRVDVTGCKNSELTYNETKLVNYEMVNVTKQVPLLLEPKHIYDPFYENDSGVMVNYLTAIVQLDSGIIIDAIWDGDRLKSTCKDCGRCLDGQCGVKPSSLKCDTIGCQLKIFVAWAGVDRFGKKCISINKIPSAFRKYSTTPISELGLGLLNDFIYRVDSNTANPNQA